MNRRLHKIIFNRRRQCMTVVAEHTPRGGKNSGSCAGGAAASFRSAIWALAALALTLNPLAAAAQVAADGKAPANQRPVVLKNPDGSPNILIQTPSASGLSHNRYIRFDVDAKGAVLNNSRTGNPYLGKGAARLILNEIRSHNPSKLEGIVKVEGARADVIIANPAGIQVNGAVLKMSGAAY